MFFEVKLDHYVPEMDQAKGPSRPLIGRIEPELLNIWTLSLSKLLESTRYIKYEFYKQFFFSDSECASDFIHRTEDEILQKNKKNELSTFRNPYFDTFR